MGMARRLSQVSRFFVRRLGHRAFHQRLVPNLWVTYDGQQVWFASGDKLNALDPASGKTMRTIDVAAHAG